MTHWPERHCNFFYCYSVALKCLKVFIMMIRSSGSSSWSNLIVISQWVNGAGDRNYSDDDKKQFNWMLWGRPRNVMITLLHYTLAGCLLTAAASEIWFQHGININVWFIFLITSSPSFTFWQDCMKNLGNISPENEDRMASSKQQLYDSPAAPFNHFWNSKAHPDLHTQTNRVSCVRSCMLVPYPMTAAASLIYTRFGLRLHSIGHLLYSFLHRSPWQYNLRQCL